MDLGILVFIYFRRINGSCSRELFSGYRTTRHLLRGGTLSLRFKNGGSFYHYSWPCPLVTFNRRSKLKPKYLKSSIF